MDYQINGAIPQRGLPLNGWSDKSIPGSPIDPNEQWGALPRYSTPTGALSVYGIPQRYIALPPIPTPPVSSVVGGAVGGGGAKIWSQDVDLHIDEIAIHRARLLREDEEIIILIATGVFD